MQQSRIVDTASATEPNSPADLCARSLAVLARADETLTLARRFVDEDREFQALLDGYQVNTEPKWFRAFIDDCYVHNSPGFGTDEYRASKMSVPRNRLHRTMEAVNAGLSEGANLRAGLAAGRDLMHREDQGVQEPPTWAEEPLIFTGTPGELESAMALGALRSATLFRIAAQIEKTPQVGRAKILNDLYRRVGLND